MKLERNPRSQEQGDLRSHAPKHGHHGQPGRSSLEIFLNRYHWKNIMSTSSSSIVREVEDIKTGKTYVCKTNKRETVLDVINEVTCLKRLDHPSVIKCADAYVGSSEMHLLLEPLCSTDLESVLVRKGRLSEKEARLVTERVLHAVQHLHKRGVVHRNLKPSKILFKDPGDFKQLYLVGFGMAALMQEDDEMCLSDSCGSALYVAPEVLAADCLYNEKCDLWSIGVILYQLLTGQPPILADCTDELLKKIRFGQVNFEPLESLHLTDSAKNFVQQLLTLDLKQRPSAAEALLHPWIANAGARLESYT
uniref:Camk cdpk protein kinase n=1 Tax=Tetraselmis sp. GSL018 TaxID=582737 RepID=A0A061QGE0_9CHLO